MIDQEDIIYDTIVSVRSLDKLALTEEEKMQNMSRLIKKCIITIMAEYYKIMENEYGRPKKL